ncbi:hypothetical protein [Paraglaciecola hydrolytica]|uniref:Uncharacterized protein n=1 Tax=Paraglaciecola hydrolytica TaxID=1799789 RepID=A0A136A6W5_9ALTE|nr:hypothetical protein [Paraglaciecola hydrolytica]KXI30961.1 hypothetical protein AX660_00405 [Paraglaciecola hydrolytica]
MNSHHAFNLQHPNTYKWPAEELTETMSTEMSIMEFRIQIAVLNKRLDKLNKIVQQTLNIKQQEKLIELMAD